MHKRIDHHLTSLTPSTGGLCDARVASEETHSGCFLWITFNPVLPSRSESMTMTFSLLAPLLVLSSTVLTASPN